MADRPMNPYATEDFSNAIRKASEDLKAMTEKMKDGIFVTDDDIPFVRLEDLKEEYCGTMKLGWGMGMIDYYGFLDALLLNGYEITMRKNEEFIEVEYGEVE